ncbi:MAG: ABC transporter permease [Halieaceae bacterium]|jgi:cell division transport system permease protein|nr:ABC transporter permease [Halieaceae bacterium]
MNRPAAGLGIAPRRTVVSWVHHHRQAASSSLLRALRVPVATGLTWLVVGIALALPASLLVILQNIEAVTSDMRSPARFSVLLESGTSLNSAQDILSRVESRVDVRDVTLIPKDQALARFAADTGLVGLLDSIPDNPLPHTLLVNPLVSVESEGLSELAQGLKAVRGVDQVVFDTLWQARLAGVLQAGRRLVMGIGLLIMMGAVLILANTIRLAIDARRDEIVVIKLIGANNAYARRPFLYTGLWSGFGGGLLGAIMVGVFFIYLSEPVNQLLQLYNSDRRFTGLGIMGVLNMMFLGGALGLLSAWHAATSQLRELEPR